MRAHVMVLSVPRDMLAHIVGKGGSKIAQLKQHFDVRIEINEKDETADCIIEGSLENCSLAKAKILDIIDVKVTKKSFLGKD